MRLSQGSNVYEALIRLAESTTLTYARMRTQAVTGIDLKASSCFQLSIGFGRAGSNPVAFGVFCGRFSIGAFDMKSRSAQLCSKQTEPEFLVS